MVVPIPQRVVLRQLIAKKLGEELVSGEMRRWLENNDYRNKEQLTQMEGELFRLAQELHNTPWNADLINLESDLPSTRIKGIVRWFNDAKGYGFIDTATNTVVCVTFQDIISNDNVLTRTLKSGDLVEFETEEQDGELWARKVKLVET